ncbi:MAG TPA: TSUP family transporter [Acidimicrobiia bacterium]|nr:TSUP family transporter [Acidimicrobiia bacterium]
MANDVVLVAVGCLTGVLAGMVGAGGGFATVALLLAAGAAPHVAVGTALVYMMVMGGWGAFMHVHLRSVDRRLAIAIGAAAALSALAGAQIAEALSGRDLVLALGLFTACVSGVSLAWPQTRRPVELPDAGLEDAVTADGDEPPVASAPSPVRSSGSGAVSPFAYGPLREALRAAGRGGGAAAAGGPGPLRAKPAPRRVGPVPVPGPQAVPTASGSPAQLGAPLGGAVVGGSIIGLLKGLFGVGGGFLIVPVISRVGRVPREVAVGSSLFAILVASVVAALRHWTLGNVDGSDLLALVPGGLFGSFVGARAARSMSPASIRRVFLAVMLGSTVYLILFRSAYR